MFGRSRTFVTIAACALAMPATAQVPATTTFDGMYVGVSNTFE
jgi:hypothetical protein